MSGEIELQETGAVAVLVSTWGSSKLKGVHFQLKKCIVQVMVMRKEAVLTIWPGSPGSPGRSNPKAHLSLNCRIQEPPKPRNWPRESFGVETNLSLVYPCL